MKKMSKELAIFGTGNVSSSLMFLLAIFGTGNVSSSLIFLSGVEVYYIIDYS
jgi:hypothetical protein